MLRALPLYSLAIADVPLATSISRNCTVTPVAVFRTLPTTTPSAPSSFQRSSATCSIDGGCGIDPIGVARDQVELSLEFRSSHSTSPIVFAAAWVSGSLVSAMKSGTAIFGGRPGVAGADSDPDLALLLGLRRRGRGRLLSSETDRQRTGDGDGSGQRGS